MRVRKSQFFFFLRFWGFRKYVGVCLDFHPFFFGNIIFASSAPRFSAPETVPNTPKISLLHNAGPINTMSTKYALCVVPPIFQKKVFFGVKSDTIETKATTWIHDIK